MHCRAGYDPLLVPYARGAFGSLTVSAPNPTISTSDQLDERALSAGLIEFLAGQFKSYAEGDPAKLTFIDPIEMRTRRPNLEKLLALYAKELPVAAAVYSAHRKR